jgi:inosine-uridine nucleoside N-ribohydrolase
MNGTRLHGPEGLGTTSFPCAKLHHAHPGDKLINDLVRQHPKDVTLIVLGPLTTVARAMDRDPELAHLVHRIICVGGAWHEAGNATAAAEFHFYCDTAAGRFLRRIAPHGIGTTSNLYGIEGFHLKDVLGIVALTLPGALSTRPTVVDVETRGELTRGMSVIDTRWTTKERPNVDLAVGVDVAAVRKYMEKILH